MPLLPPSREERCNPEEGRQLDAFRKALDGAVQAVARENQGRIHPDLLRMPLVALALSNAALRSVGKAQLHAFLTFAVRAGLQPGKSLEAEIVPNAETGVLELRPRVVFASRDDAEHVRLPGEPAHFGGNGGQPIGLCDNDVLQSVLAWIDSPQRPNRAITHARLRAAIELVLRARGVATATQETP